MSTRSRVRPSPTRGRLHGVLAIAAGFALIACGPPRASSTDTEPSGDDSTTATSSTSDEASETSETETGGDPTSTTAGAFVPEYDSTIAEDCDSFAQDCPEGEKCVAYASTGGNWDATKCVPVTGGQGPGEPCEYGGAVEATDDCRADSMCWDVIDVDGQLIGECAPFCTGTIDDPMCPESYQCLVSSSGLNPCIRSCNPITQDCNEGLACYWATHDFDCIFTTQDIPPGQPCGFINDCVAGSACMDAEVVTDCAGSSCCAAFCSLAGGDGPCAAGTACVAFFAEGMAPPVYEDVGVCVVL